MPVRARLVGLAEVILLSLAAGRTFGSAAAKFAAVETMVLLVVAKSARRVTGDMAEDISAR